MSLMILMKELMDLNPTIIYHLMILMLEMLQKTWKESVIITSLAITQNFLQLVIITVFSIKIIKVNMHNSDTEMSPRFKWVIIKTIQMIWLKTIIFCNLIMKTIPTTFLRIWTHSNWCKLKKKNHKEVQQNGNNCIEMKKTKNHMNSYKQIMSMKMTPKTFHQVLTQLPFLNNLLKVA